MTDEEQFDLEKDKAFAKMDEFVGTIGKQEYIEALDKICTDITWSRPLYQKSFGEINDKISSAKISMSLFEFKVNNVKEGILSSLEDDDLRELVFIDGIEPYSLYFDCIQNTFQTMIEKALELQSELSMVVDKLQESIHIEKGTLFELSEYDMSLIQAGTRIAEILHRIADVEAFDYSGDEALMVSLPKLRQDLIEAALAEADEMWEEYREMNIFSE